MSGHTEVLPPSPAPEACAFLVGRDDAGQWLAVEVHGLGGGLFRDERAAVHYAASETDHRPGAVRLCAERLTLGAALAPRPRA